MYSDELIPTSPTAYLFFAGMTRAHPEAEVAPRLHRHRESGTTHGGGYGRRTFRQKNDFRHTWLGPSSFLSRARLPFFLVPFAGLFR